MAFFREKIRTVTKTPEPQDFLEDMKLKNPDISVMICKALNLNDENFHGDYFEGRYGRKYYHLIELDRIRRCLLQIPIAISTLQFDEPNKVWDAIDFLRDSLLKKYMNYDLGLFIIHEGKIHPSFNPYAIDSQNSFKPVKLIMRCVDLENILYLKNYPEESRRMCLQDYFALNLPTADADALQEELAHLEKLLEMYKSNLAHAEEIAAQYGMSVPIQTQNEIKHETDKIAETKIKIEEVKRKMGR